jgi:carbonic anhydrase/acetyltransferase-like protein (isoleucine patch superfamily)
MARGRAAGTSIEDQVMGESNLDCRHRPEQIHPSVFTAPGAVILGDVTIGERSSVWYGAVLRGDLSAIVVGSESNVQDCCIIHVKEKYPCRIGDRVTLGHGAILHGCTVEDDVLIGIHAIVLDGAVIGHDSIVGAGAVVTQNTVVQPGSLVLGVPARVVDTLSAEQREQLRQSAAHYVEAAQAYEEAST